VWRLAIGGGGAGSEMVVGDGGGLADARRGLWTAIGGWFMWKLWAGLQGAYGPT
jgi:hypothetical protein